MISDTVFMKQEIWFVPDVLFFVVGAIQLLLFIFTTFSYFILVYVVSMHSPHRIGNYKWYIIINASFGFGFEVFTVGLHMYPLLPYPILVLHGFVDFALMFGQPPQIVIDIVVNVMLSCIVGLVYSTMCMFVFRWLQTTQNRYLRVITDIKFLIGANLVNAIIVGVTAFFPLNLQLLDNDELHEAIKEADPLVYEKMKGHIAIGFNIADSNYYRWAGLSFFIELMIISAIMLTCAILCYRYLQRNEYLLSRKTVALFRSLINLLMIDLAFATVTGFLTITSSMLTFVTGIPWGSVLIVIALMLADLYPLFTHILVLVYIEPYRVATVKFLGLDRIIRIHQAFRWDDATTSTTQTTVTVIQTRRSIPF